MTMTTLDFRGKRVRLVVTAGDSLNLTCTVTGIENLTNPVFKAQVKDWYGEHVVDFTVTPTAEGAVLMLTADDTRALSELEDGGQLIVGAGGAAELWHGSYDVQLSHDPGAVRTFMKGELVIEGDVTE